MKESRKNTFYINKTKVVLEDIDLNKGEITILDSKNGNYQMFWGAMGTDIKEFILSINSEYFSEKLLGFESSQEFDVNKTFKELRRFICEDLSLPWYKHMEFQKNLREKLNYFQKACKSNNSEQFFVDNFNFYLTTMPDFYLIKDKWESQYLEEEFKSISEPWHFIHTKENEKSKWLKNIHMKIKKKLWQQEQEVML